MTMPNPSPEFFMRRAISLSRKGYPAPNPHVGCVLVKDGDIVGEGWHQAAGMDHAEAMALRVAGHAARGATAYVTMEPCSHHGRTPPCADALIKAGVVAVSYALPDPNPKGAGGGEILTRAGVPVECGVLAAEAEKANHRWLEAFRLGRPYVVAKVATTANGYLARADGTSKWITGTLARREARRLRAELGAVLVGKRTALLDDPLLTPRLPKVVNQPVRLVMDFSRELPETIAVFSGEQPGIRIVAPSHAREEDIAVERGDLSGLLKKLWERGVTGLLVEGGAYTLRAFLEAGLVDEIALFVAPHEFENGMHWVEGAHLDVPEVKNISAEQGRIKKGSYSELGLRAGSKWRLATRKRVGADTLQNYLRSKRTL